MSGVNEKIKRGDALTIWGVDPRDGYSVYADVEYLGRTREKEYKFKSTTYGWKWFLTADRAYIYNEISPNKKYPVDDGTGWTNYLP